jgi:histidine ammonia-lyase
VAGAGATDPQRAEFLAEVEALREELAAAPEYQPGHRGEAAHKTLRKYIKFMGADRAWTPTSPWPCAWSRKAPVLRAARDAL